MSLVLGRYLNYRSIQLRDDTKGEIVGVRMRSGEYRYVRWLGFIGRERATQTGRPCKLEIARIGRARGTGVDWQSVPKGSHIQGCLTREGAFAVVEASVRVI
jgi:hypothetical protein